MKSASQALPGLSEDRISAMERGIFDRIDEQRRRAGRRRRRALALSGAAVAVLVAAAAVAPAVSSSVSIGAQARGEAPAAEPGVAAPDLFPGAVPLPPGEAPATEGGAAATDTQGTRDIVATGSASVVVDDVATAAAAIAQDARERGGYVESLSIQGAPSPEMDGTDSSAAVMPYPGGGNLVVVRVPADQLEQAVDALARVGEVTDSTLAREDVTEQTVDLRARVAAAEASVARLTQLMAEAESVGDLIAAESALAERQAALEADRRQLEYLESRVALSSLSVQLTPRHTPVEARPAGFADGIAAGWSGLVAAANAVVVALGFLLPWLATAAAAALIVWAIVVVVRWIGQRSRGGSGGAGGDVS